MLNTLTRNVHRSHTHILLRNETSSSVQLNPKYPQEKNSDHLKTYRGPSLEYALQVRVSGQHFLLKEPRISRGIGYLDEESTNTSVRKRTPDCPADFRMNGICRGNRHDDEQVCNSSRCFEFITERCHPGICSSFSRSNTGIKGAC